MKKSIQILFLMTLFFGFQKPSFTKNETLPTYEEKKYIKKNYQVSATATLVVKNKFGDIEISTWDKNLIEIEIEIISHDKSKKKMQEKLERISVNFEASPDRVSAVTKIGKRKNKNKTKRNDNSFFEIHYTIKIPKEGSIDIKNSFGDIYITEILGDSKIQCSFGKLSADRLMGGDIDIDLSHSRDSCVIEEMTNVKMNVQFSTVNIGRVQSLNLKSGFSKIRLSSVKEASLDSKFGKTEIQTVDKISVSGNHGNMIIRELKGDFVMDDSNFGSLAIDVWNPNGNKILINSKHKNIIIGHKRETAFNIEVEMKYAKPKFHKDILFNRIEDNVIAQSYKGFYKTKNSENIINVHLSFGKLKIVKR